MEMPDNNIPSSGFNFGKDLNLNNIEANMIFSQEDDTFQSYLINTNEEDEDENNLRVQQEIEEEEANLKSSLIFEELEESIAAESVQEEDDIEEDKKNLRKDDEREGRKLLRKDIQLRQTKVKNNADEKTIEQERLEDEESSVAEENNHSVGQSSDGKKNQAKLVQDRFKKRDENMDRETKIHNQKHHQESLQINQQKESSNQEAQAQAARADQSSVQQQKLDHDQSKRREASIQLKKNKESKKEPHEILNMPLSSVDSEKTAPIHADAPPPMLKSSDQKELEQLVLEILAEAKVLDNGDVQETTISLNMKDSIFDKSEVKISAYKFRPLEINLEFKKLSPHAAMLMKKNVGDLKNILKRKSLKVHQLDIIE